MTASLSISNSYPFTAIYSGTSFDTLSELNCAGSGVNTVLTFQAVAGQTYYIQIGDNFENVGGASLTLEPAPPPIANFYTNMGSAAVNEPIQFINNSDDPANVGIATLDWDFGDGSTSTELYPFHSYSADGDYLVTLTVTTFDGRTNSFTRIMEIRTHDVSITKILAPTSARIRQTRTITVSIRNTAYPETVRVELYRSIAGGEFQWIGTSIQFVPVRGRNRTSQFIFNYTFSAQDVQGGTVTFKAVAFLENTYDARFEDNERISAPPTIVKH